MNIRQEKVSDYKSVFDLIKNAFESEIHSDHREQFLVERLRKSDNFIPELSIVAENNGEIVGYILLTKIKIKNSETEFTSLALAPVAVKNDYQNNGIGSKLILFAHSKALELNYDSIALLGHENYYPKFGYKTANQFNIKFPFDVPDENCMLIELKKDALLNVNGTIVYPKEFYE
jgi:predicted N-acetyltransferase YhbS